MIFNKYDIDTPALLIDLDILSINIDAMGEKCKRMGVALRPHTKTHKCSQIAQMQVKAGAVGIAVAKVGEAEVMAKNGIDNILIANQIIGLSKLERISEISKNTNIMFGVDSIEGIIQAQKVFEGQGTVARVLIEVETGEVRSGTDDEGVFASLVNKIKECKNIEFMGIFSHEGHTYKAESREECLKMFAQAQEKTLYFSDIANSLGSPCTIVSIGATPSILLCNEVMAGITEVRPGTYALMDVSQGNAIESHESCCASVLLTITSKPTLERIIGDGGAKALTMQTRSEGICKTEGLGMVKGCGVFLHSVFDEHAIIYSQDLSKVVEIGDKIEVIPNHICPVVNLYDKAYFVSKGKVLREVAIDCRGKIT